jgi:hypothetical protein
MWDDLRPIVARADDLVRCSDDWSENVASLDDCARRLRNAR